MKPYELLPIGYVRNSVPDPDSLPYNGAPSVLELLDVYQDAAAGLTPGYVWVICWLDQSPREPFQVRENGPRGSFASRTPNRLNPIAITATRLERLEPGRLHVDALDVCDGTPLLDVKPYVREFDCIFGPADPAWRRAAEPLQRLQRIVRTIERFCGPLTPETALAARVALAADRDLNRAVNNPELVWECSCAPALAGALQAVCGAPLGSPRFHLGPNEQMIRVGTNEIQVTYRLHSPILSPEDSLAAPEEALLQRIA